MYLINQYLKAYPYGTRVSELMFLAAYAHKKRGDNNSALQTYTNIISRFYSDKYVRLDAMKRSDNLRRDMGRKPIYSEEINRIEGSQRQSDSDTGAVISILLLGATIITLAVLFAGPLKPAED